MLKIGKIPEFAPAKVFPDVFVSCTEFDYGPIDISTGKADTYATSYIEINDDSGEWINNEYILKNSFVYFFSNKSLLLKVSLKSLKTNTGQKNINTSIRYKINNDQQTGEPENTSISYYCGNELIRGNVFTEQILFNNKPVLSSAIAKNKDLRILDVSKYFILEQRHIEEKDTLNSKDVYISYNKSKKANIAYVFNLEKFLLKMSKPFRILSKNQKIKKNILENSTLDSSESYFYKKNLNTDASDYQRIVSEVLIKKTSSSEEDSNYILTLTDDNNSIDNKNIYNLKTEIYIRDTCYDIVKTNFLDKIDYIKEFINLYKNELDLFSNNKSIKNYREYYYINEFEKYFLVKKKDKISIVQVIRSLSDIFSITTGIADNDFIALFSGFFHPLSYRPKYFELILEKIEYLQNYYNGIFQDSINTLDGLKKHKNKFSLKFEQHFNENLDYNYDSSYSFDVIKDEQYLLKDNEEYNGLYTINSDKKDNRISIELNKFLVQRNTGQQTTSQIFSINNLFLGDTNFYFSGLEQTLEIQTVKNIFVRLSEYNNYDYKYSYAESIFSQLLDKNIYIKTLGATKNTSKKTNFKDILFDSNKDSKEQSTSEIIGTGIEHLFNKITNYIYIDAKDTFNNFFKGTKATVTVGDFTVKTPEGNKTISINNQENKDIEFCKVFLYNNFFIDNVIISGSNCSLYKLDYYLVNDIFKEKLKLYNQYYIVEDDLFMVEPTEIDYSFENNFKKYNILPKYTNITLQKPDNPTLLEQL